MYQIKYLSFLIIIIFILITFGYYDRGFSQLPQELQEPQSHFIPHSEKEKHLAGLIHRQIHLENFDKFVRLLDKHPQYINIVNFYATYESYFTPLQYAVRLGRDRFIDELLRRGADPTLPTLSEGNTLLHISSRLHITEKLIALNRIDIDAYNFQGMTPLLSQVSKTTALKRGVIYALLKAGADPNAKTSSKMTALHILFKPYHSKSLQEQGILLAVLRDLLEHKAEVNARTKNGLTPLHFAASSNNATATQMLLDHGAKVYARTNYGLTPLHFAAGNNNVQAIQVLIAKAHQMERENQTEMKNFINWKDSSDNTALFIAYTTQSRQAITELSRLGADPLLKNKSGLSVKEDAHKESRNGSPFAQFVLDEIAKTHCAHPLTK